jgi:pimeloyl-ACP methyl ester carboxylesterase
MTALAFTRRGAGAPLVLLHGIGSARQAWDPVVGSLAEQFDVLAIDLPGFGESRPLPAHIEPLPAVLAATVASFLDDMNITAPHIAGNSLGGWGLARILVLGQTHGQPARITPDYARMAIRAMGTCPGFDATMKATEPRCYLSGPSIDAPVTVGFGSRDFLLLPHQSRHLDELPPGTRVDILPGCGHVPMADNPRAVTTFITAAAARADKRGAPS